MQKWLKEVARGKKGSRDLTYEEALEVAKTITSGQASEAQIAAFLIAERMKEESPEELQAFVEEFHRHTAKVSQSPQGLLDCAGPYGGRKTFAATIPVSLLLASKGIPVLLHGSDSLPPKFGVSLKAIIDGLGVASSAPIQQIESSLTSIQIAFAETELHCPPLAKLRGLRKEIGVRSLMNTVEKLLRVAQGETVLLGAFHRTAINNIIPMVKTLPYKQFFIIQGVEGTEDIPIHRNSSFIYKQTEDGEEVITIKPSDFGIEHQKDHEKEILTLDQQISIMTRVIDGDVDNGLDYYRDQVILNAGVRYWLLEHVADIATGIKEAESQLRSGKAREQLEKWQKVQRGSKKRDNDE